MSAVMKILIILARNSLVLEEKIDIQFYREQGRKMGPIL